jgi:hypothetical protein
MLKRINKHAVMAQLRKGKNWSGYMAPSNVIDHICNGWHIGYKIDVDSIEKLEDYISNYAVRNCNSELGNRVVLWQE